MYKYDNLDLNYIDGEWVEGSSKEVIESIDPYTEDLYATVRAASAEDLDKTYEIAKRHQKEWEKISPFEKVAIIRKAIKIIEDRKEESKLPDWDASVVNIHWMNSPHGNGFPYRKSQDSIRLINVF